MKPNEIIKSIKDSFILYRDKTDIWAGEERWNKFEKMFMKNLNN